MNPPKAPLTIRLARQLRRRIIPLYTHHDSPATITLWRRPFGAPIRARGGLELETFKLFQPSESASRSRNRYLARKAARGTLLRDRKGALRYAA